MKFINIEKNIIENKKLSNLSNTPPCPGINSLEFFKLFILLKYDSIRSPKNEVNIIINMNEINFMFILIFKK